MIFVWYALSVYALAVVALFVAAYVIGNDFIEYVSDCIGDSPGPIVAFVFLPLLLPVVGVVLIPVGIVTVAFRAMKLVARAGDRRRAKKNAGNDVEDATEEASYRTAMCPGCGSMKGKEK